ncbi:nitroreductase family protein [Clostridium sp. AL.422]|uniref:nitroreductase family protein n=1 Tax=Clostridium TaxID=1485 RepID=UPI00293DF0A4|nr:MULTISPECIES: nitroreductase family protein [unclassified Clostridium]MDV4150534.1 nitroreductase family protein [Clostridium sp. AL.422]
MNNLCVKSIENAIRDRYSVRNYSEKELSEEIIEQIEDYINTLDNPFDIKVRIGFVKKEKYDGVVRLGTYGVIKGANYYLVGVCEKKEFALEALGYTFEKVILYCTSLGLGSVWLGASFNKSAFEKTINLRDNEILPVVSPIGYEGGEKSFLASFIKDHRNVRKNFSDLFFDKDFNKPLIKQSDLYSEALEMVRLSPSSINSQPWKIVKDDGNLYIYSSGVTKMNKIDMGIALCHLDLYLKEKGINGEFKVIDPQLESKYKYVISWIKK